MVVIKGNLRELHTTSRYRFASKYYENSNSEDNYLKNNFDEPRVVQTLVGWKKSNLVRVLNNYEGINRVEVCPSAEDRFCSMVNSINKTNKKIFGEGALITDPNLNLLGILKSMPGEEKSFLALSNVRNNMGFFGLFRGGIYSVDKKLCDLTTEILKSRGVVNSNNMTPTIVLSDNLNVFPERFIQKSKFGQISKNLPDLVSMLGKDIYKI